MGVELHRVAHDVGHLVIPPVVHALHGVQYAPLHGLQSVLYVGHGTLQYHVRSIVEKPVLVHPAKVMHGRSVKPADGLVPLATGLCAAILGLHGVPVKFLDALVVLYLVVHDDVVVCEENAAGRH